MQIGLMDDYIKTVIMAQLQVKCVMAVSIDAIIFAL